MRELLAVVERFWPQPFEGRFFPLSQARLFSLTRSGGFDPERYRRSWPDLEAALPDQDAALDHFITYLEWEVRVPRSAPMALDFDGLDAVARAPIWSRPHKGSLVRNLAQMAIDYRPDIVGETEFWRRALKALAKVGRPLVVAGDSHSRLFRQTIDAGGRPILPLNLLCGGGSASGLPRAQSRSGYGQRIAALARALGEAAQATRIRPTFALAFGQVDLEFVQTHQRIRRKEYTPDPAAFEAMAQGIAARYVDWVAAMPHVPCAVLGVNPPCIDDEFIRPAYLAQMQVYSAGRVDDVGSGPLNQEFLDEFARISFADQRVRTHQHRLFNAALAARSGRAGIPYFDCFDDLLGQDGLIRPEVTFAADGYHLAAGHRGADIHIGGSGALAAKAKIARQCTAHAFAAYARPRSGEVAAVSASIQRSAARSRPSLEK